jgi:hypothetical protein
VGLRLEVLGELHFEVLGELGELGFELVSLDVLADRLWGVVGRRLGRAYLQRGVQRALRLLLADGEVDVGQVRVVEVDFGYFFAEVLVVLVEELGRFEELVAPRVLLAGPTAVLGFQEALDLLDLSHRLQAGLRWPGLEGRQLLFLVPRRKIQSRHHHHLRPLTPKDAYSSLY